MGEAALRVVEGRERAASAREPAEEWLGALRAEGKSPRTVETYGLSVRLLLEHTGGELPTRRQVRSFVADQIATRFAGTAVCRLRGVKSFTRWLHEEGEAAENVAAGMREPQVQTPLTRVLRDDELRALIADCERFGSFHCVRDLAILRLYISTGVRLSEGAYLRLADVDLGGGVVRVVRGKVGRSRRVALTPVTAQAVLSYLRARSSHRFADLPQLWVGKTGAVTANAVYKILDRRARSVGIEDLQPHSLRHTWAHRYLASGGTEIDAMQLGGWTSVKMLQQVYGVALAGDRALAAASRLRIGDDL
ncbi:MAG: tyrosine-type recombinase/integrase [Actinomycetota bacterium]